MRPQGTPTVGDLKREIEDLHARVEELEEREGLSDVETAEEEEEKESRTGLSEAVREYLYYEGEL